MVARSSNTKKSPIEFSRNDSTLTPLALALTEPPPVYTPDGAEQALTEADHRAQATINANDNNVTPASLAHAGSAAAKAANRDTVQARYRLSCPKREDALKWLDETQRLLADARSR